MSIKSILYIGQYGQGTTARMRIDTLTKILDYPKLNIIDIGSLMKSSPRIWRSIGFRYKIGPLINLVNKQIAEKLKNTNEYELIWIDKNIFISEENMNQLKSVGNILVHYTPDCAFYLNHSKHFISSLKYFDFVITTKSFELPEYYKYKSPENVIYVNQGYDKSLHRPYYNYDEKDDSLVFIGLYEKSRANLISHLLKSNIQIKLGGKNWQKFVGQHSHFNNFQFIGDGLFKGEYAKAISASKFGLGLLSKKFPELHTTRTIEIPACGTALLTERNPETEKLFDNDEVIFYKDLDDLVEKTSYYTKNPIELKKIIARAEKRVSESGYDYQSILNKVLNKILSRVA